MAMLKNWKAPTAFLVLLVLAMVFRWDSLASTTNNGVITTTQVDRWNGAVWQETIKNGSYTEKMISQSWIESGREPIEKQVEYKAPYYKKVETNIIKETNKTNLERLFDKQDSEFVAKVNLYPEDHDYDSLPEKKGWIKTFEMKTKTVQEAPPSYYWLSRDGLTKLWGYITAIMAVWLLTAITRNKKENRLH